MNYKSVVLVVEDQPIIRLNALDAVMCAGFEALGARDADEAVKILEARHDIRLVFTDVEMPGSMNGIELAYYIRSRWHEVHLIVTSGRMFVNESDLPPSSKFFAKPYDEEIIVAEMKRTLSANDVAEALY